MFVLVLQFLHLCLCFSKLQQHIEFLFFIFVTPRNSATCKCVAVTLIIIPRPVKSLQPPNAIMCQGLLTHKNPQLQPFCLGPLLLYACKKKKKLFFLTPANTETGTAVNSPFSSSKLSFSTQHCNHRGFFLSACSW